MLEMNQKQTKFDNVNFNKLLAYSSIINSLNYKWYKSSKRRLLLPNFYFTRLFYTFYRLTFFKNLFRKKIQSSVNHSFFNPLGFFEKKMFLKHVNIEDFLKNSNSYSVFFKNSYKKYLFNEKFFFKKPNNNCLNNYNLFVSKDVNTDLDLTIKLNFFKKNQKNTTQNIDFNVLVFFYIYNSSIIEIYKIFILTNFNILFNK